MKALLIVNPRSGRQRVQTELFRIVERLDGAGYDTTVVLTKYRGHAAELAARAGEYDLLVCTGGDGTLNEVISGLLKNGLECPIGYIPLGSTNDLAGSLGIPSDVDAALDMILEGEPVPIDVGRFNGRYFLDVGLLGIFSRTCYETPQDMKNTLGFLAYVLEGIREVPTVHPIPLRIEAGDAVYEGEYLACVVSNSRKLGGVVSLGEDRVDLSDGKFELLLVEKEKTPMQLHGYIRALRTADLKAEGMTFVSVPSLRIISPDDQPWTLDGERADWQGEADIEILPRAARLLMRRNGGE